MFAYLNGKVDNVEKDKAIIEVNGVGYLVNVPEGDAEKLTQLKDKNVKINIHTDIKENDITLYGFLDKQSLSVFQKLIRVSGVGCKMARGILSFMTPQEICIAIANEDAVIITNVPGVGGKTAARIILELKDKILKEDIGDISKITKSKVKSNTNDNEAMLALKVLGYTQFEVSEAIGGIDTEGLSVEAIIKKVLQGLNKR